MPAGTVINGVKDFVAAAFEVLQNAQHEFVFLVPSSILSRAGTYGSVESAKRFIDNGGVVKGILPISLANIEETRVRLKIGEELRFSDEVHELFMFVGDRRYSVSAINVGVEEYTLDTPVTAFWSDDPTYAEYLLTSFESVWSQATPAEERIQELLKQGPP